MDATSSTSSVTPNMKPGPVGRMYTLRCVSVMLSLRASRDWNHS